MSIDLVPKSLSRGPVSIEKETGVSASCSGRVVPCSAASFPLVLSGRVRSGPCQFIETAGHCRGSISGLWDRDSWLGFQNPSIVVGGRKFASFYPVVRVGFQVLRNELRRWALCRQASRCLSCPIRHCKGTLLRHMTCHRSVGIGGPLF